MKLRRVGSGTQIDAQFAIAFGFMVILSDSLADFAGGGADDGIGVRVVFGAAAKNSYPEGAFFERFALAGKVLFHDVAQQGDASFAALERRVCQQTFQLLLNRVSPRRSLRPSICSERPHCPYSQPHTLRPACEITVAHFVAYR